MTRMTSTNSIFFTHSVSDELLSRLGQLTSPRILCLVSIYYFMPVRAQGELEQYARETTHKIEETSQHECTIDGL